MSSRYRLGVLGLPVLSLASVARNSKEEVEALALQLQGQPAHLRRRWLLIAMSVARRDGVDTPSRRWACKIIAAAKLSFYARGGTTLRDTYARESLGDYVKDDLDASTIAGIFGKSKGDRQSRPNDTKI